MLLELEGADELGLELEATDTEVLELDKETLEEGEPSITPSFTSRPAIHTSALAATATASLATSMPASTSTRREDGEVKESAVTDLSRFVRRGRKA
jgi:hypothetical protein